jgi:hypothetical protein
MAGKDNNMGTRNLTIVKLDGKVKIAQYCQWDGYPTGQGKTIAEFIQTKLDKPKFIERLKKVKFVRSNKISKIVDELKEKYKDNASVFFKKIYPQFHRDTGAAILELIQDQKLKTSDIYFDPVNVVRTESVNSYENPITELVNDLTFLKDATFCEFAYEIDLNKETVTVYQNGKNIYKTFKFSEFTVNFMSKLEKEMRGK